MIDRPADLHPIEASALHARRERVFLILTGLFLGAMTMLNILGISRFIKLGEMTLGTDAGGEPWTVAFAVAVGVLPYPITFLCTDFISELYGRRRANNVVWMGLALNVFVLFNLWLGGALPGFETLDTAGLPTLDAAGRPPVFFEIRALAFGAVIASMAAYLAAQLVDVHLFHFWKRLTRGRHLWLRNNASTLASQLVDSTAVILITHYATPKGLPMHAGVPEGLQILAYIGTGYAFKAAVALVDTVPFYFGVRWLSAYLQIDPNAEFAAEPDAESQSEV